MPKKELSNENHSTQPSISAQPSQPSKAPILEIVQEELNNNAVDNFKAAELQPPRIPANEPATPVKPAKPDNPHALDFAKYPPYGISPQFKKAVLRQFEFKRQHLPNILKGAKEFNRIIDGLKAFDKADAKWAQAMHGKNALFAEPSVVAKKDKNKAKK